MTDAEILAVIQQAVREETGDFEAVVTPATRAEDVAGWDSLAHGRIMMSIEAAVGGRMRIEDTYEAGDVGELVPVVRRAAAGRG